MRGFLDKIQKFFKTGKLDTTDSDCAESNGDIDTGTANGTDADLRPSTSVDPDDNSASANKVTIALEMRQHGRESDVSVTKPIITSTRQCPLKIDVPSTKVYIPVKANLDFESSSSIDSFLTGLTTEDLNDPVVIEHTKRAVRERLQLLKTTEPENRNQKSTADCLELSKTINYIDRQKSATAKKTNDASGQMNTKHAPNNPNTLQATSLETKDIKAKPTPNNQNANSPSTVENPQTSNKTLIADDKCVPKPNRAADDLQSSQSKQTLQSKPNVQPNSNTNTTAKLERPQISSRPLIADAKLVYKPDNVPKIKNIEECTKASNAINSNTPSSDQRQHNLSATSNQKQPVFGHSKQSVLFKGNDKQQASVPNNNNNHPSTAMNAKLNQSTQNSNKLPVSSQSNVKKSAPNANKQSTGTGNQKQPDKSSQSSSKQPTSTQSNAKQPVSFAPRTSDIKQQPINPGRPSDQNCQKLQTATDLKPKQVGISKNSTSKSNAKQTVPSQTPTKSSAKQTVPNQTTTKNSAKKSVPNQTNQNQSTIGKGNPKQVTSVQNTAKVNTKAPNNEQCPVSSKTIPPQPSTNQSTPDEHSSKSKVEKVTIKAEKSNSDTQLITKTLVQDPPVIDPKPNHVPKALDMKFPDPSMSDCNPYNDMYVPTAPEMNEMRTVMVFFVRFPSPKDRLSDHELILCGDIPQLGRWQVNMGLRGFTKHLPNDVKVFHATIPTRKAFTFKLAQVKFEKNRQAAHTVWEGIKRERQGKALPKSQIQFLTWNNASETNVVGTELKDPQIEMVSQSLVIFHMTHKVPDKVCVAIVGDVPELGQWLLKPNKRGIEFPPNSGEWWMPQRLWFRRTLISYGFAMDYKDNNKNKQLTDEVTALGRQFRLNMRMRAQISHCSWDSNRALHCPFAVRSDRELKHTITVIVGDPEKAKDAHTGVINNMQDSHTTNETEIMAVASFSYSEFRQIKEDPKYLYSIGDEEYWFSDNGGFCMHVTPDKPDENGVNPYLSTTVNLLVKDMETILNKTDSSAFDLKRSPTTEDPEIAMPTLSPLFKSRFCFHTFHEMLVVMHAERCCLQGSKQEMIKYCQKNLVNFVCQTLKRYQHVKAKAIKAKPSVKLSTRNGTTHAELINFSETETVYVKYDPVLRMFRECLDSGNYLLRPSPSNEILKKWEKEHAAKSKGDKKPDSATCYTKLVFDDPKDKDGKTNELVQAPKRSNNMDGDLIGDSPGNDVELSSALSDMRTNKQNDVSNYEPPEYNSGIKEPEPILPEKKKNETSTVDLFSNPNVEMCPAEKRRETNKRRKEAERKRQAEAKRLREIDVERMSYLKECEEIKRAQEENLKILARECGTEKERAAAQQAAISFAKDMKKQNPEFTTKRKKKSRATSCKFDTSSLVVFDPDRDASQNWLFCSKCRLEPPTEKCSVDGL